MASSSSSSFSASSQSPKKYDVFISFRGEDTRTNFTSHLHAALCRNSIETYIDYRLEKGDEVWLSLVKAVEDSTLFLIIFSENYASSTWCLNELTKVFECSKEEERPVLPVFYKIDPSHVRKQTGSYEIAFAKHEQSNHKRQVHKWRDVLTEAANLSGWDSSTFKNEAELIREIVKGVLIKLDTMDQNVYLDGLIGIQEQIAHLESLMCTKSQDVRFIGIWGMGGIGKTTIAKALFNKFCIAFESFCFLDNVREESEKHGIVHLRSKLLSALLEDKESGMGIPDGVSNYIWRRLCRKKVLVVLDDVDDPEQMKILAGKHHWFGKGSRVIITTRNKQVLCKTVDDTYKVGALGSDEALHLFVMHAFENNCFDNEFEQLSWKVVVYAQGIPLALIVLGSFLCGKGKEEWKSQLEKLKKMPYPKIHRILKLSYDGLDYEEKNIFLDVACFFKGRQVENIKPLLDACGYSTTIGLKSLQEKSLLSIFQGRVSMHDLIQEMGLEIVREESLKDPEKRSRLWDADDIYPVLKYNRGSDAIKGISLDMSKMKELNVSPQVFAKMDKLIFLEFYNYCSSDKHIIHLPQGLGYLSNEVRYLRWDDYPSKSLPLTFSAENLVQLEMKNSRMRTLWQRVQNVVNLKTINLRDSKHLMEFPDLSKAIDLEQVDLSNCVSLCEVHPSILSLDKLEVLALSGCVALASLKSNIRLRSLCFLFLDGCSNLKEFSVTSENMWILNLKGTAINELPSSMGQMFKLECLYLNNCESLKNIGSYSFHGLQSLTDLHLYGGCKTSEVIDQISMSSSLVSLSIEEGGVECLPASMMHLSSLQSLTLYKCEKLQSVHLPPSIKRLYAIDCTSLEKVQFTSATLLSLKGSEKCNVISSFQNCLKLDEHSINAVLANSLFQLDRQLSKIKDCNDLYQNHFCRAFHTEVMYPGSSVPKWFKYRTTHDSITIDLSSAPLSSLDWTLLFCIIAPKNVLKCFEIECRGNMRIINDEREDKVDVRLVGFHQHLCNSVGKWTSDHVCLWYNHYSSSIMYEQLKRNRATSNTKILLELYFHCIGKFRRPCAQVKGCGACPTYASEYQNFIKELKMESEASACYQNNDEQQTVPPRQKSKDLIFPPLSSATWKIETKGLKDIIDL